MFYISMKMLFAKYKVRHFDLQSNCDIQVIKLVKTQCIWGYYREMQSYFIIIKTVHKVPIIFWWHCSSLRVKADMAYFYEKILTSLHHSTLLLCWLHDQWIMVLSYSRCNEIHDLKTGTWITCLGHFTPKI